MIIQLNLVETFAITFSLVMSILECKSLTYFAGQSLEINFLSAYLESSGSEFSYGVNFAVSGASTVVSGNNPFSLSTQTGQFRHFQNRTRELREQGACFCLLLLLFSLCLQSTF